jgi:hypothetical protein
MKRVCGWFSVGVCVDEGEVLTNECVPGVGEATTLHCVLGASLKLAEADSTESLLRTREADKNGQGGFQIPAPASEALISTSGANWNVPDSFPTLTCDSKGLEQHRWNGPGSFHTPAP